MTPKDFRAQISAGEFTNPTAGYCNGYVQANLVVLDKKYAEDFKKFCEINSKPCPLIEMVGPGTSHTSFLADNADICTTIPRYHVWEEGKMIKEVNDITSYYNKDMSFFLLGCSFSFEESLMDAGIALRHVDQKINVAMYDTNIPLKPVGPFHGYMVVSMRPIKASQVSDACCITGNSPIAHGAPVHVGMPELIGISDLAKPDYGDAVEIKDDEIPVFWACGVTPQNALQQAKLDFAITHAPGCMFVSDILNKEYGK